MTAYDSSWEAREAEFGNLLKGVKEVEAHQRLYNAATWVVDELKKHPDMSVPLSVATALVRLKDAVEGLKALKERGDI